MHKYAEVQMKRKFIHFYPVNCSQMFLKEYYCDSVVWTQSDRIISYL